jgi:hypothetical protein
MAFGFRLLKSKDVEILKAKARFWDSRPAKGLKELGGGEEGLVPITPISYIDIQEMVKFSDTMTTIINAITQEIFRNGGDFEEKFVRKCLNCHKEYETEDEICESCGGQLTEPDSKQLERIKPLFEGKAVNDNGQSMAEVSEQLAKDLEVFDICYIFLNKDYEFVNGELKKAIVKEILRGDPTLFRIIADKKGRLGRDSSGKELRFCLEHRHQIQYAPSTHCQVCGKRLFSAQYVAIEVGTSDKTYYSENEILHTSKYTKSLTYGWPLPITVYQKVLTLMHMDGVILDWYKGRKPPRGVLLVATRAQEALQKAWEWLLSKLEKNPGEIFPLAVDTASKGKVAEFISIMNNLEEMQYSQTREEIRRTIGAVYGVMPIFEGDTSTSGGLNNEGLQVTVTTRAAMKGQIPFNDKIYDFILKEIGVTDWRYVLNTPEEKDEMAEKQRFQIEAQTAQQMLQMGFDVKLNENREFEYSGEAKQPSLFGGMGGIGQPPPDMSEHTEGQPATFKSKSMVKEIIFKTDIEEEIEKAWEEIERDEDKNLILKADELKEFLKKAISETAFSGVSKSASDRIKEYLLNEVDKRISMKKIVDAVMKFGEITKPDAERIVRTEFQSVLKNKAREYAYLKADPEGEYKYKWLGPTDHRTTAICKKIKSRTARGVSMDKLKQIIKQEADPAIYQSDRPFTPHINCRHVLIRVVQH